MFNSKLVVRAGWGMYYDRGELYSYLSPGLTQNITNGGPFGINQQQPFVNTQFCPTDFARVRSNPVSTHPRAQWQSTRLPMGGAARRAAHRESYNRHSPCPIPICAGVSNPQNIGAYHRMRTPALLFGRLRAE